MGAYAKLIDSNGAFAEFVHTYATLEEKEEEEKEAGRYLLSEIYDFAS